MTQAAKAQEPSMEEILASIRRIIADDDASKSKPPESAQPAAVAMPAPPAMASPPHAPARSSQADIDALLGNVTPFHPNDPVVDEPSAIDPAADILDLTPDMEAPPQFQTIDGHGDVVAHDAPAPLPPLPREPEPPRVASVAPYSTMAAARHDFQSRGPDRGLMSHDTAAAVDSAFNSLADTVLVQNSKTLDDLAREMLRPMLKAWLDDNLPNLVERLVRSEIERVSRGR